MPLCPFCNSEVSQGAKFCAGCGKDISRRTSSDCPFCGIEIIPGKKFCHKCGSELNSEFFPVKKKSSAATVIVVLSIVFVIIGIIGVTVIYPNFIMARDQGQLAECESIMKNIATALEMYAVDHEGNYPPSLAYLTDTTESGGSYMKSIPVCPACRNSYLYESQMNPDNFVLKCGGENTHINAGSIAHGHYPIYTPGKGLILNGEYNEVNQTSSVSSSTTGNDNPVSYSSPVNSDSQGQFAICESNLKNMATALEMYAVDHEGNYPPSLAYLTDTTESGGGYIKSIPVCPACGKPYIYERQMNPDTFILKCGGENAHTETGSVDNGHFPAYTPSQGIVLRGELPVIDNNVSVSKSVTSKKGLTDILKENYTAIDNKDFMKAYNLRSKNNKKTYGNYDAFYKNWRTNITISLEETEILSETDENAKVRVRLYSEDKNETNGKIKKAYYGGNIYFIKENGEWKINNANIEQESSLSSSSVIGENTSQEKQDIESIIYTWAGSVEEKDLSRHVDCYADKVDLYFGKKGVTKDYIWEIKEEAFGNYKKCEMSVSNMDIDFINNQYAVATFDKEWNFTGNKNFSGKESQKLKLKKFSDQWKITSEEELEVYWVK